MQWRSCPMSFNVRDRELQLTLFHIKKKTKKETLICVLKWIIYTRLPTFPLCCQDAWSAELPASCHHARILPFDIAFCCERSRRFIKALSSPLHSAAGSSSLRGRVQTRLPKHMLSGTESAPRQLSDSSFLSEVFFILTSTSCENILQFWWVRLILFVVAYQII